MKEQARQQSQIETRSGTKKERGKVFDYAHRAFGLFFFHLRPSMPPSGPRKQFAILCFAKYRFAGFDCQCAEFADFT